PLIRRRISLLQAPAFLSRWRDMTLAFRGLVNPAPWLHPTRALSSLVPTSALPTLRASASVPFPRQLPRLHLEFMVPRATRLRFLRLLRAATTPSRSRSLNRPTRTFRLH